LEPPEKAQRGEQRMISNRKRTFAALGAALGLIALMGQAASAQTTVPWSGSTTSGTDPYGNSWRFDSSIVPSWGAPGLGFGTLNWPSTNDLNSLSVVFDLPLGVAIDQTPASGPFGLEFTTRFSDITDGVLWNTTFQGANGVTFTAPVGATLTQGKEFFYNVAFTGAIGDSVPFSATYNGSAVPEPGTFAMIAGLGASGCGLLLRRRRAAR
jgi:hypothetical protein